MVFLPPLVHLVFSTKSRALCLARNTIAIKFAENDHSVAEMVARAFTLFENFCTSDQAYAFYNEMMENPKLYDRVMQFVTLMLIADKPLV